MEAKEAAEIFTTTLEEIADLFAQNLLLNAQDEETFNKTQESSFNTIRDSFVKNYGLTKLQAANMTRVVLVLVKKKLGQEVDEQYMKGALANAF